MFGLRAGGRLHAFISCSCNILGRGETVFSVLLVNFLIDKNFSKSVKAKAIYHIQMNDHYLFFLFSLKRIDFKVCASFMTWACVFSVPSCRLSETGSQLNAPDIYAR